MTAGRFCCRPVDLRCLIIISQSWLVTWLHTNFDLVGNQKKLSEVNPPHKPIPFSHSHIQVFIVSSRDGEEDRKPGKAKCGGIGDTGRNKEADHGGRGCPGKLLQTWREPGGKLSVSCMPATSQHLCACMSAPLQGDRDGHISHCRHHTLYPLNEGDKAAPRRGISFSMWPRTLSGCGCSCSVCLCQM